MACGHKQRACALCGVCPRCPGCTCGGPRRSGGRPANTQPISRRAKQAAVASIRNTTTRCNASSLEDSRKPKCSPRDLFGALNVPTLDRRLLPSNWQGLRSFHELEETQKNKVLELLENFLKRASRVLLPSCGEEAINAYHDRTSSERNMQTAVMQVMKASKKGSIERKMLRALLCATVKSETVAQLLRHGEGGNEEKGSEEECEGVFMQRESLEEEESARIGVKRVGEHETSQNAKRLKLTGAHRRRHQQVRKDWDVLMCLGKVRAAGRTIQRCSDETVRKALKFLFRPEYVQMLSWGNKRIRLNQTSKSFPSDFAESNTRKYFQRVHSCWSCSYTGRNGPGGESTKLFGRSAFMQIVQFFTRGQQKRKAAVDFVLGTLVYDNLRTAREIVSAEVVDEQTVRELLQQLVSVEEFLKFSYLQHIGTDDDPLHSQDHAFAENDNTSNVLTKSNCDQCLMPFKVFEEIRVASEADRRPDIDLLLKEIGHKTLLYMGHQHRCKNQEQRIASMFSILKEEPAGTQVVLLIDFKMKFEPIKFREKTTEFFGKKAISWHGAAVFYRPEKDSKVASSCRNTGEQELSTLFFDHLVTNDMTQDRGNQKIG